MSNSTASYKQQKEAFVSGHNGGSVAEILAVTGVAPVALVLWSVLQTRQSFFDPYTPIAFTVDFLLNIIAVLLATTLYAHAPVLLILLLAAPAVLLYGIPAANASRRRPKKPKPTEAHRQADVLSLKPFLTNYRGSMLALTCLAILAVDFPIFPRRFAKVETWGTSLMDIGVGSFVYSGGLVSARPVLREVAGGKSTPLAQKLIYSLRHSFPLLVLGVIRLLSVKGLDYAEHVTEYGVHWNFFFTLGFLPPFVAILQPFLRIVPSYAVLSIILGVVYQVLLESTRLKAFILIAPRTDLISMNREGIFSFLGYLAIFFAGMDAGTYVLPRTLGNESTSPSGARRKLLVRMGLRTALWTSLYVFTTNFTYGQGLDVSRRMANLPYVLWTAWYNSALLMAFCVVEALFFPSTACYGSSSAHVSDGRAEKEAHNAATSRVLRAFNRNGLAVFLLANLLTGAVNMTLPTLTAGPLLAMGILVGYSMVITGVAVILDVYNISIKL
ncbi:Glucosaminyl phosphatidylinositol (GlcN-PI) nositol acylation protein [Pyricularia grisea]|uniref:GPI-anchored wall transfer protein n=1 Tax=Pyricularia grisea TaxID=148305 RepID=A0A6P8BCR2_PYRGI|nr:uncharacterized protein PgNI_04365 [Pyricularia grisea]KAI6370255.1 Glucosaminyl phosphatidylinositol (GlcN-PI) nositol acylation protein [Pyricularia grisea]TLD13492.1 hypothetical protein PgNI_04365 [Pyricularia grisea]